MSNQRSSCRARTVPTIIGRAGTVLALLLSWCVKPSAAASDAPRGTVANADPADASPIRLRFAEFDPHQGMPAVPGVLHADADNRLWIVQFHSSTIERRAEVEAVGGIVRHFIPDRAYLVELDSRGVEELRARPGIRWIGPYHPAYRLDPALLDSLINAPTADAGMVRYNVQVVERGPRMQRAVADHISVRGGEVHRLSPQGFRLEATMDAATVVSVLHRNEIAFIDRWTDVGYDMDIVRESTGANLIEQVEGFTGAGVRAEVMDGNVLAGHVDFQARPPLFHGPRSGDSDHGTSTYGICFGAGVGSPNGRGLLPDAQGIFADLELLDDRYLHTGELLAEPYRAVFQSNSWGNEWTTNYTTISAELDDILLNHPIVLLQSMSNQGSQQARPQAWAKNAVSVGGVFHQNTVNRGDDLWGFGASIGPAADGRIKPDLVHYYDQIFTTAANGAYRQFCCTSAATPITAGHFGLMFEMWNAGLFGNQVDPIGDVFDHRPRMATSKAMMINSAAPYAFSGVGVDLTRTHQGWGLVDAGRLLERRGRMLVIDGSDPLVQGQVSDHTVVVLPGETEFRATLVYPDPAGLPATSRHRVNDLHLRVVSPDGTSYWGNNGLLTGNWSIPGGVPNTLDTVENVLVQEPAPGSWMVEVQAAEVVLDAELETPEFDVAYSLVVSGAAAPLIPGDCDADHDVELSDFPAVASCLAGPFVSVSDVACACADVDDDGDVDLMDVAALQYRFDCVRPLLETAPVGGPVCPGETVTLSCGAAGNAPLQYQWLLDGMPIEGATHPAWTIDSFDAGSTGAYSIRVTNACGMVESDPVNLSLCEVLFADDFEIDRGWTIVSPPSMTRGQWMRAVPTETSNDSFVVQPGFDNPAGSGTLCMVTGSFGGGPDGNDVDNGPTELFSPVLDLSGHANVRLRYAYWYYRNNLDGDDGLKVSASTDGGATWQTILVHEDGANVWRNQSIDLDSLFVPTDAVQLRFSIQDTGADTTLEALIDDVEISVGE